LQARYYGSEQDVATEIDDATRYVLEKRDREAIS
jgi:hypothetical protein